MCLEAGRLATGVVGRLDECGAAAGGYQRRLRYAHDIESVRRDSVAGAALKPRAVVRRAERSVTLLYHKSDGANKVKVPYLNRWSSLVFGLAR